MACAETYLHAKFHMIHLTVWPQYTNVTRRQRSDRIGRTVLQTVAQNECTALLLLSLLLTRKHSIVMRHAPATHRQKSMPALFYVAVVVPGRCVVFSRTFLAPSSHRCVKLQSIMLSSPNTVSFFRVRRFIGALSLHPIGDYMPQMQ